MMEFDNIKQQANHEWDALFNSNESLILVGNATCGKAAGAESVIESIRAKLQDENMDIPVIGVGCIGICYAEPLVDIIKPGMPRISYHGLTPETAQNIVDDYLINDNPRTEMAMGTIGDASVRGIPRLFELPMFKPQKRIVLRNCGFIDPTNISHYIANEGYAALQKALDITPEEVIRNIQRSGLRGRGGAGFPTGQKWKYCLAENNDEKYMICNADEGDPGAFMDRSILESDPHSVLEGMLIAAYAIEATHGYIYVRDEYPLAIERFTLACTQAREKGLLGDNILGSGFTFDITIKRGAGSFVCGEETALIASIEGKRGMPRPRPPFPAQQGVWGRPTNINNVKTLATVPTIIRRGAEWFSAIGSSQSPGTAVFALTGKIKNSGLVEVPMGTPLRSIIYDVGGGIPDEKRLKAVQTGGPSGGCIPAHLTDITFDYESLVQDVYVPANYVDLPIDYETLARVGSIMGSGGMVVMDEDTCMVDVAHFFLSFTQYESCGKCPTCRIGTKKMKDILEKITQGRGELQDINMLEELAITIKNGSLCGLGQTAPNPVLTTLRYFREEYVAHIRDKRCPAKVCKSMIWFEIDADACVGCTKCAQACPVKAIDGTAKRAHCIDQRRCSKCGMCYQICPVNAVDKKTKTVGEVP
jgi:NADH:ubiquinone oxidoreductase subunit F (NADH-binding)/Pyruvate/2-oxoacid:ferredoxin oxidoreductase delta subunit/(2Fe-2S) ferredoxin